jgi:type II secretory pathway component PulC
MWWAIWQERRNNMPTPKINPLVKLFKSIVILLLLVLAVEIAWFGIDSQLFRAKSNEVVIDYSIEPPAIKQSSSLDAFRVVVSRSLFNLNRRPKTIGLQLVSEVGLLSRWQLSGVVSTGNETYALFSEVSGDRRLRLEQGMYLEKWKLKSITAEQVRLSNEGEVEVFHLRETNPTQEAEEKRVKNKVKSVELREKRERLTGEKN